MRPEAPSCRAASGTCRLTDPGSRPYFFTAKSQTCMLSWPAVNWTTEEELRRIIRDAGFVPKRRDTLCRTYLLN